MMAVVVYTTTKLWFHHSSWSWTPLLSGHILGHDRDGGCVYTISRLWSRFSGPLQTLYNSSWGPNSICFTLAPQHDTNMEDNMDLDAEWNELANKTWTPETQLARKYTDNSSGLLRVVGPVCYSLSPSLQKQKSVRSLTPSRFNKVALNGHFKRNRTSVDALGRVEPADIQNT